MPLRVLLGDDAFGFRLALKAALQEAGVDEVIVCEHWNQAADLAEAEQPDAILVDLLMPTFESDELVRTRNGAPNALLAVISSYAREDALREVEGIDGIDLVFSKRQRPSEIAQQLLEGLRQRGG